MSSEGTAGEQQRRVRRRRTSTRLIVFAGSSWGRIFATFLVTVYLTRLLMDELGAVLAGLFYMLSLMTRFLVPLRAALSQVMTREAAAALAVGDDTRLQRVFSNAVAIAGAFSLISVLLMGWLTIEVARVFNIPAEYVEHSRLAMVCETVIAGSVFFVNPWLNLYIASQRIVAENVARTTERLLDLIAAMVAFWALPRLEALAGTHVFVLFIVTRMALRVGQQVGRSLIIRSLVPAARFRASLLSRRDLREIGAVGGWSISNAASNMGFYAVDQPFINVFFGPVYNAVFSVVARLQAIGQMLGGNLAFGVQAMAADHHEMGRHELNRRILLTSMRLTSTITAMCTAGAVLLSTPIVDVWLGDVLRSDEELMAAMPYAKVLEIVAGFAIVLLPSVWFAQAMLTSTKVLYGMGLIRRYSPSLMYAAGAKLLLTWIGLRFLGAGPVWIVWSTVIAQAWCFGWVFPTLIREVLGLRRRVLFAQVYGRPLGAIVAPTVGLLVARRLIHEWDLSTLVMVALGAGVLFAPGFFFVALDAHERSRVLELVKTVRRRALRLMGVGRVQRSDG